MIDEFHFIGTDRGTVIEEIIIEMKKRENEAQLLLLSSSIANPENIAQWLGVKLVLDDYRPVPLSFEIKRTLNVIKEIKNLSKSYKPIIVFINSRSRVEKLAKEFSRYYKPNNISNFEIEEYIKNLSSDSESSVSSILSEVYFPPLLKELVKSGIGYHHAGLSDVVRLLIEQLYLQGKIKILFTTSTLSAGINLPAALSIYILDSRRIEIDNNLIFQTLGRAGRLGLQNSGKGIVLTTTPILETKLKNTIFDEKNIPKYAKVESKLGNYDFLVKYYLESIVYSKEPFSAKIEDLIANISSSLWFYNHKKDLERIEGDTVFHYSLFTQAYSPLEPVEVLDYYKRFDRIKGLDEKNMSLNSIKRQENLAYEFAVKEGFQLFRVTLSPLIRSCSCQNKHSNFICRHQRFVIRQHPEMQEQWLNSYGIVDLLVKEGFIVRSRGNVVNPTPMGKLTSAFFVHPYDFLDYLELVGLENEISFEQFFYQVLLRDKRLLQEMKANELSIMQTLNLTKMIMEKRSVLKLCQKFNISDSFITDWKENLVRYSLLFDEIKNFIGNKENTDAERD